MEDQQTKKIKVCSSLELLEQIERYEGEQTVLGGLDEVVLKRKYRDMGNQCHLYTYSIVKPIIVLLVVGFDVALLL